MTTNTLNRRSAREWAVQMLTTADLNPPQDVRAFMDAYWEQISDLDKEDGVAKASYAKLRLFAEERVTGVLGDLKAIDEALAGLLDNWDIYRLGTVERVVLRMGIWEMKATDVPKPVVVNECVDLVNWFASPRSRTLINAVLDKYAKSLGK